MVANCRRLINTHSLKGFLFLYAHWALVMRLGCALKKIRATNNFHSRKMPRLKEMIASKDTEIKEMIASNDAAIKEVIAQYDRRLAEKDAFFVSAQGSRR